MTVLGCTGHQTIPPTAAKHVEDGLTELAQAHADGHLVGVCSLAKGADQMFAEAVLSAGGRLQVVVPSEQYESTFDEYDLVSYISLLSRADDVEHLGFDLPSEDAFLSAGRRVAELCDLLVAVWDGTAARGRGGTADVVAHARELGRQVEIVWPEGVTR